MRRMAEALRKIFGLSGKSKSKGQNRSGSISSGSSPKLTHSKESINKKSKKASFSSSSMSSLSSPSSSHNSQSTKINSNGGLSTVRTHQIVPTTGKMSQSSSSTPKGFSKPCTIRIRRLMKEYKELSRVTQTNKDKCTDGFPLFSVELVNDCLHEWNVKVYQFDADSQIYNDMKELGIEFVLLNVTFPENYPFAPPFIRVVSPHIEKGFVMEGGAICMELLTRQGWASAYTMEAVVMQLTASFVKGQARIKRDKKGNSGKDFSKKLAEASFRNVIKIHDQHGWVSPPLSEG